jgi:hypothetical protein
MNGNWWYNKNHIISQTKNRGIVMNTKIGQLIIGIGVLAVIAVVYFLFLSPSVVMKPKDVLVDAQSIKVSDPFGIELKMENVKEVLMKDSLPKLGQKVNGAGIGNKYTGKFEVEGMGAGQVYTETDKGPFIYIYTKDNNPAFIIINYEDKNKTQSLFDKISSFVKK